ncbi:MAG: hypothetical protein M5U35_15125 [Roseovarius sp.]|nr:hypothetical protein [Roseovarius sp.]
MPTEGDTDVVVIDDFDCRVSRRTDQHVKALGAQQVIDPRAGVAIIFDEQDLVRRHGRSFRTRPPMAADTGGV